MTTTLLAIDPGNSSGWALFSGGVLTHAGTCRTPPLQAISATHIIAERPTIYPTDVAKPAGIITLAIGLGRWLEANRHVPPERVTLVEPRSWKGSVKKTIHHERCARALTAAERAAVVWDVLGLDARDAVCLGLFGLGRVAIGGLGG